MDPPKSQRRRLLGFSEKLRLLYAEVPTACLRPHVQADRSRRRGIWCGESSPSGSGASAKSQRDDQPPRDPEKGSNFGNDGAPPTPFVVPPLSEFAANRNPLSPAPVFRLSGTRQKQKQKCQDVSSPIQSTAAPRSPPSQSAPSSRRPSQPNTQKGKQKYEAPTSPALPQSPVRVRASHAGVVHSKKSWFPAQIVLQQDTDPSSSPGPSSPRHSAPNLGLSDYEHDVLILKMAARALAESGHLQR